MHQVLEYRIRFVRVNCLIVIRPTCAFSVSVSLDSILAIWDLFGFYDCQLEESGMKLYVRIHNHPLILSFSFSVLFVSVLLVLNVLFLFIFLSIPLEVVYFQQNNDCNFFLFFLMYFLCFSSIFAFQLSSSRNSFLLPLLFMYQFRRLF